MGGRAAWAAVAVLHAASLCCTAGGGEGHGAGLCAELQALASTGLHPRTPPCMPPATYTGTASEGTHRRSPACDAAVRQAVDGLWDRVSRRLVEAGAGSGCDTNPHEPQSQHPHEPHGQAHPTLLHHVWASVDRALRTAVVAENAWPHELAPAVARACAAAAESNHQHGDDDTRGHTPAHTSYTVGGHGAYTRAPQLALPLPLLPLRHLSLFQRSEPEDVDLGGDETDLAIDEALVAEGGDHGVPATGVLGVQDPFTWLFLRLMSLPGSLGPGPEAPAAEAACNTGHKPQTEGTASSCAPLVEAAGLRQVFAAEDHHLLTSLAEQSVAFCGALHRLVCRPYQSAFALPATLLRQVSSDNVEARVRALMGSGCWQPRAREPGHGRSALHLAAEAGAWALAARLADDQALLEDVLLQPRDDRGWTPLHLAARAGHGAAGLSILCDAVPGLAALDGVTDWLGRTAADLARDTTERRREPDVGARESPDDGGGDGGWPRQGIGEWRIGHCDIAQVLRPLSSRQFVEQFVAAGRPVVLRGHGAAASPLLREAWQYGTFLDRHGGLRFPASRVPYSHLYGASARTMPLRELAASPDFHNRSSPPATAEDAPLYVFTELGDDQVEALRPAITEALAPPLLDALGPEATAHHLPQFYLGAAGSGAPMHFHQDALNTLVYGEKRWFLLPPGLANFETRPSLEWHRDVYPGLAGQVLECMQHAGDIVYVPAGWGHALLNTRASIGTALNFEQPFSTF